MHRHQLSAIAIIEHDRAYIFWEGRGHGRTYCLGFILEGLMRCEEKIVYHKNGGNADDPRQVRAEAIRGQARQI